MRSLDELEHADDRDGGHAALDQLVHLHWRCWSEVIPRRHDTSESERKRPWFRPSGENGWERGFKGHTRGIVGWATHRVEHLRVHLDAGTQVQVLEVCKRWTQGGIPEQGRQDVVAGADYFMVRGQSYGGRSDRIDPRVPCLGLTEATEPPLRRAMLSITAEN